MINDELRKAHEYFERIRRMKEDDYDGFKRMLLQQLVCGDLELSLDAFFDLTFFCTNEEYVTVMHLFNISNFDEIIDFEGESENG